MSPKRVLPAEIGLLVIDQLGLEGDESPEPDRIGRRDLKKAYYMYALYNCALTCKEWLHRSRINLYRTVHIYSDRSLASISWTLVQMPWLGRCVRTLRVDIDATYPWPSPGQSWRSGLRQYSLHHILTLVWAMLPQLERFDSMFQDFPFPGSTTGDQGVPEVLPLNNRIRLSRSIRHAVMRHLVVSKMPLSGVICLLQSFPALRHFQCDHIAIGQYKETSRPPRFGLSHLSVRALRMFL